MFTAKRRFSRTTSLLLTVSALMFAAVSCSRDAGERGSQSPDSTLIAENLAAHQWFQDAKFGMFIHWGVYSVLGNGEWVMHRTKMNVTEYAKLPPQFNPTRFDAAEWVALAKAAGMKYITITSKHHDGFCMFHTQQTKWNIVDGTPYGKDVLKMLAEECEKQGIKLFFYYSQLDWHHTDYFPRGRTGEASGRPEEGDWNQYLDYMDQQLRELCTNYGKIGGIWFDGWWDRPDADWRLEKTYKMIHELQPQALIGSNHHQLPFPGEDFQMWEKDLPGASTASFNKEAKVGNLPLETCDTINKSWGYNKNDKEFKSTKDLIQYLVRAAGFNANFLLNVGPKPDGTIQDEFVERLKEIGAWMSKNGESVYGTRAGPVAPQDWGVTTLKGNLIYVHVLDSALDSVTLPGFSRKVNGARLLGSGGAVELTVEDSGLKLSLKGLPRDAVDTIVILELEAAG